MTTDLNFEGNDYNVALFIFFVPYILFEVPSNIIIKKIAPSTWLSGIMFCWGIVTIGQGCVTSKGGLIACRFLLGLFESGFFPGITATDRTLLSKTFANPCTLFVCRLHVPDLDVLQTLRAPMALQHLLHRGHPRGFVQRTAGVCYCAYGRCSWVCRVEVDLHP